MNELEAKALKKLLLQQTDINLSLLDCLVKIVDTIPASDVREPVVKSLQNSLNLMVENRDSLIKISDALIGSKKDAE